VIGIRCLVKKALAGVLVVLALALAASQIFSFNSDSGRAGNGRFPSTANNVSDVRDEIKEGGGLTIQPLTGDLPESGYLVGLQSKGIIINDDVFFNQSDAEAVKMVKAFIDKNQKDFKEGKWLGFWHDVENDEVAVDVVANIQGKQNAKALGSAQDQQAIWDVVNQKEIDTKGTGSRGN